MFGPTWEEAKRIRNGKCRDYNLASRKLKGILTLQYPLPEPLFFGSAVGFDVAVGRRMTISVAVTGQEGRLLRFVDLIRLLLVVATVVLDDVVCDQAVCDANNEEQPEEVKGLQTRQQNQSDILGDPALVLLASPVKLKRPDGTKFCE